VAGFSLNTSVFSDVRCSNKVPMYHRPSGEGWGCGCGGGGRTQQPDGCYGCEYGWKFTIDPKVGHTGVD
jgi:hypothetical protein